jgi:DNA-damage-inducible protein D
MSDENNAKNKLNPSTIPFAEVIKRAAPALRKESAEDEEEGELLCEGSSQLTNFKGRSIRQIFHNNEWYFSIVDVIAALTESERATKYWTDLKKQIAEKEGFAELSEKIGQLKMPGSDGKMYPTEAVNVETLLRIIQSIPSPKADPFKRWLAKVGFERIQETHNPEIGVQRAMFNWRIQGRTDDWIEARLRSIVVRHELTSEWARRGVKEGKEFGYLTNVISKETFGLKTDEHKELKGLKYQNLRDHMTDLELIFTMLGEKSTTAIAQATNAQGLPGNERAAKSGGKIAGDARRKLEIESGKPVLSKSNFLPKKKKAPELPE